MADNLIILYSPNNRDYAQWAFVNSMGQSERFSQGSLESLAEIAQGNHSTVLLDSSCLNINQVNIPTQNRQRQLQAIPYALEDILADDIEDLHFAAGKKQDDEDIPVITIKRSLVESIINQFKETGIVLETLTADVLGLPLNTNQWTLLIDQQRVLIKTSVFNGYYCDLDLLDVFLQALFKKLDQKPDTLLIYLHQQQEISLDSLNHLGVAISVANYADSPLNILAQNSAQLKQLNILQGDYTVRRESSGLLKPWKSVAAIFFTWLCLQLITAGFEINQLQEKNTQLTGLIEKEFKSVHPGTKNFSSMRKRMTQKLAEARGDSSDEESQLFLKLLADAGPALSSNDKVIINGIVFRNKFVDLDLQADSLQSLEAIKGKLTTIPGMKIVMSTSVEKDKVKGRLRLEQQG